VALAFNKFRAFAQDIGRKVHNLNSDTIKFALSNTAPANTNAVLADITQITAANGYSSGGSACTGVSYTQVAGTATLAATQPTFTASSGTIGPFQYIVAYNSTASGGPLIGWWDRGGALTLQDTDTYTPTLGASGILTLA